MGGRDIVENTESMRHLFEDAGRFRVPDYQRPFAWDERQIRDLVEDALGTSDGHVHFFGTVVLHRQSVGVFDIVDGQQRLTGLTLLMDAMRRRAEALGCVDVAEQITAGFLRCDDGRRRLELFGDLDRYLDWNILGDGGVDSPRVAAESRLQRARNVVHDILSTMNAVETERLFRIVADRFHVVRVVVGDASEVGIVFETMNNRGKSLSELEKVKNHLLYVASRLGHLDETLDDEINRVWAHMYDVFGQYGLTRRFDEDQLLRTHWLATQNARLRDWDGADGIRRLLPVRMEPEALARATRAYIASLRRLIKPFAELSAPDVAGSFADLSDSQSAARIAAAKLHRLGVTASMMPLLSVARLEAAADPTAFVSLLELCERYAFRVYRLARWQPRSGAAEFARTAFALWGGGSMNGLSPNDIADRVTRDLIARCPDDRLESILEDRTYNWYQSLTTIRHLLFEYEELLTPGRKLDISWSRDEKGYAARTVEHIFPQVPRRGDYSEFKKLSARIEEHLTHDIGNLCLTYDNFRMSNRSFSEKKTFYAEGLRQERELVRYSEWTPETLDDRRGKLVDFIRDRWGVDGATSSNALAPVEEDDALADDHQP